MSVAERVLEGAFQNEALSTKDSNGGAVARFHSGDDLFKSEFIEAHLKKRAGGLGRVAVAPVVPA